MTQYKDDASSMEVEAPEDAFTTEDQTAGELVELALAYRSNPPIQRTPNYSQIISDENVTDEEQDSHMNTDEYNQSVSYSSPAMDNTNTRFPQSIHSLNEDQWLKIDPEQRYFIRKQSRTVPNRRDVEESDIDLDGLSKKFFDEGSRYFHATNWASAEEKRKNGPKLSEGPLDLAYNGAFYLSPNYRDCHDWFFTKDSKFQGQHAMLIYKFHAEHLSKQGECVLEQKKWKRIAGERSKSSPKCKDDWIYTYQNRDPTHVLKSGDNVKMRIMRDGQPAMQLVIYTKKMCRKIHECLIGCVYYEYRNPSIIGSNISTSIVYNNEYTDKDNAESDKTMDESFNSSSRSD